MTHKEFARYYGHNAPYDKLLKGDQEFVGACNGLSYWYKIFKFTADEAVEVEEFCAKWDDESHCHEMPGFHLAVEAGYKKETYENA